MLDAARGMSVIVISAMGAQSTGKSYQLNHLGGCLFDASGGRCTDGIWMTNAPSPLQFRIMLFCDQNAGCRLAFTIVYDLKPVPVPIIFAVSAPRFVNALQFLMLFSQTRMDLAD